MLIMVSVCRMRVSGLGHQARPCLRATVFVLFLTFMTLLYHYYDVQYSNFIDYSPLEISIKNYNGKIIMLFFKFCFLFFVVVEKI